MPSVLSKPHRKAVISNTISSASKMIIVSMTFSLFSLGKVQMNVTVPHRQKGSALSSLRFAQGQALSEAKDLSAERDRPFASLTVTRWDGCNGEGLFFTTEPCLYTLINLPHGQHTTNWLWDMEVFC